MKMKSRGSLGKIRGMKHFPVLVVRLGVEGLWGADEQAKVAIQWAASRP